VIDPSDSAQINCFLNLAITERSNWTCIGKVGVGEISSVFSLAASDGYRGEAGLRFTQLPALNSLRDNVKRFCRNEVEELELRWHLPSNQKAKL
jgi:hypothetical protein